MTAPVILVLTRFFVAAEDAEDNVTQQLSNPNDDNLNLTCAAEPALKSENILSESFEQNLPSKSTGATNPKHIIDTSPSFPHSFYDLLPSDPDKWPDIVSDAP